MKLVYQIRHLFSPSRSQLLPGLTDKTSEILLRHLCNNLHLKYLQFPKVCLKFDFKETFSILGRVRQNASRIQS